jgi:hypothetical protein
MYLDPDGRLSFGAVIAAPWLFDIYLRQDSAALFRIALKGGKPGFGVRPEPPETETDEAVFAQATMDAEDVVLSAGGKRMAIVLTDDCELATLAGERSDSWGTRGRILLAGLRKASRDQIEAQQQRGLDLSRHPLPPDETRDFEGGLVDLNRIFSVHSSALVGDKARSHSIVVKLDRDAQGHLAARWGGYALREGPLAGELAARRLSQLLTAAGDPDRLRALTSAHDWGEPAIEAIVRRIHAVLDGAWFIGGPLLDDIDSVVEAELGEGAADVAATRRAVIEDIVQALKEIRDAADSAITGLSGGAEMTTPNETPR